MRIDRDTVENEIDELETRLAGLCKLRKMLDRADELSKENGGRPVTVEIVPQWAIAGPQFIFGAK
jgi:hypothetical protein